MAPSLEVPVFQSDSIPDGSQDIRSHAKGDVHPAYTPGLVPVASHDHYEHDDLRPRFPDLHWPPLTEVSYDDRGLQGRPDFGRLLDAASDVFDYTPKIGTEVQGIRLSQLTDAQKDDLARLVAVRGVVFFRQQDDFTIEHQRQLGQYFGTLHKHATTAIPRRPGLEDVHVVFTDGDSKDQRALFTPTFLWHSDVTYEMQPPSYTTLKLLSGPGRGGGGDTLWASMYAAYDLLSPAMQRYLESLTALHSADMQAQGSRGAGRPVRRPPVTTEHPLVRTHPVTGWKSLFFSPGFVTKIVGVPRSESETIIRHLNEVIATTQELHVRYRWQQNDVAIWDNRITNHSASYGFAPHRRHAVRVCCHGERPYLDPTSQSQEDDLHDRYGIPRVAKDGSAPSNYND